MHEPDSLVTVTYISRSTDLPYTLRPVRCMNMIAWDNESYALLCLPQNERLH